MRAAHLWAAFFLGAPGRAHLPGGESPLLARQGKEVAEGKGFVGDCESEGSRIVRADPILTHWPVVASPSLIKPPPRHAFIKPKSVG